MTERLQWFDEERRKHYRSLNDWVAAANKLGWDITYDRAKNWPQSGYLPYSLTPENYVVIAKTFNLPLLEVLRREGFPIETKAGGLDVPEPAVRLVEKLCAVPEHKLERIVPMLEQQFDAMLSLIQD